MSEFETRILRTSGMGIMKWLNKCQDMGGFGHEWKMRSDDVKTFLASWLSWSQEYNAVHIKQIFDDKCHG